MSEPTDDLIALDPVERLSRDLSRGSISMTPDEARYLVDTYYTMQGYRMTAASHERALSKVDQPHSTISYVTRQMTVLENQIKRALGVWTNGQPLAIWAQSIDGVGPVIAAGLAAYIDPLKFATIGKLWSYAGQNPDATWGRGETRPWNARLKTLCWKLGESFVIVSGKKESAFYPQIYARRKALELERNAAGEFADQAERALRQKNFRAETVARKWYEQGKLPPGHIHARAKRYAVKLFLSHYHEVGWRLAGEQLPRPWVLEHGGHVDYIAPPNLHLLDDLKSQTESEQPPQE